MSFDNRIPFNQINSWVHRSGQFGSKATHFQKRHYLQWQLPVQGYLAVSFISFLDFFSFTVFLGNCVD